LKQLKSLAIIQRMFEKTISEAIDMAEGEKL